MPSRYLEGNFAPVELEVSAYDLDIEGALPAELAGRYVRTGPNPIDAHGPVDHWFVGDGMVHGVRLEDGQAKWYRNRYVQSAAAADWKGVPDVGGPTHRRGRFGQHQRRASRGAHRRLERGDDSL